MSDPRALNSEMVVEHLLAAILGEPGMVASSLPGKDLSKWATTRTQVGGFITYDGIGGAPHMDLPVRLPGFTINSWATTNPAGASAPPWAVAFTNADRIFTALQARTVDASAFDVRTGYGHARILDATPFTEPTRVKADPSGFARVQFDLTLRWVVAS